MLEQASSGSAITYRPVVMDFGLARESGEGKGLTATGVMMGTIGFFTTVLMKAHTNQGNVVKVAVGYVRVSSLDQASHGVSLNIQRDKIRAYRKLNGIKLIDT